MTMRNAIRFRAAIDARTRAQVDRVLIISSDGEAFLDARRGGETACRVAARRVTLTRLIQVWDDGRWADTSDATWNLPCDLAPGTSCDVDLSSLWGAS